MERRTAQIILVCIISGFMACAMAGCGSRRMSYTRAELRGVLPRDAETSKYTVFVAQGEVAIIAEPHIVEHLATYFPGMGTGTRAYWTILLAKDLELVFYREDGGTITVYTKGYAYWGSDVDQGDLGVKGDLKSYLEALFANVRVQTAASTQAKE